MTRRRKSIVLITFLITLIMIIVNSNILVYAEESTLIEDTKVETQIKNEEKDFVEVDISKDFVISIKNPSDEEIYREVKISYYDENEEIIYTKNIDITISAFETKEIDAKQYFDSSKVEKVTVKPEIIEEGKLKSMNRNMLILIVIGIIMLLGICFLGLCI